MSIGAVCLRGDVFDIRAITVVELAFKKLHLRTQIKKINREQQQKAALKSWFSDLSFIPLAEFIREVCLFS